MHGESMMMQAEAYELVEVADCVCRTATAKAILVVRGSEEVWIPTSQIHRDSEVYRVGTVGTLVIPRWVAEMKDLPYRERGAVR